MRTRHVPGVLFECISHGGHQAHAALQAAQQASADRADREPAKLAPRRSPELALVYDQEKQKGNANRATLAVARKLVAYLLAVDRRQKEFLTVERENRTAA